MGTIINKKIPKTKLQMFKVLSVIALFTAGTEASYLKSRITNQVEVSKGRQFLAQLMQPTAAEIMQMFDSDGDGKITKKEFEETLEKLAEEQGFTPTERDLERAEAEFDKTDTSGDGIVDMKELEAVLKTM